MASLTFEIGLRTAWWMRPALWLAYPLCLISERLANTYVAWVADKAIVPYVR